MSLTIGTVTDYIGTVTNYIGNVRLYRYCHYIGTVTDYIGNVTDYIGTVTDCIGTVTDHIGTVTDYIGTGITSSSENQQNRTEVLFHYSMHHYSGKSPALNTLIFFKVNVPATRDTQSRAPRANREVGQDEQ